jgi:hypothetical protein
MAGRSLVTRLGLLTNLFVLTALTLSYEKEELRAPGDQEVVGPPASGRWCGKCGRKLEKEPMTSGSIYSCPTHDVLDDEDICKSPPNLWCRECGSKLNLEPGPSCPIHREVEDEDILSSPPVPRS